MYIGNVMLLALNLPLIGMWVKVLKVPYTILFPLILLFCLIGVYSVNNSVLDIYLMILFGVIGYLMRKFDFEPAPLALAYVLGPCWKLLYVSLSIYPGDFFIFFSRPISLVCMVFVIGLLVSNIFICQNEEANHSGRMKKRGGILKDSGTSIGSLKKGATDPIQHPI
jgi:putative tricarboxylic transport membrane protein